jgi:hypothetical protein
MIRLILAAVFVWLCWMVVMIITPKEFLENGPSLVIIIGIGVVTFGSYWIVFRLFNKPGTPFFGHRHSEQFIQELEAKGLLITQPLKAIRAFQVEESEDEGLHYFLELEDASVLYLTGQYLYEYEPITDDPEWNQPRRFPCTDFTLRWHRQQRTIVDIQCRGNPLEPEACCSPFSLEDYRVGNIPEDGQIIREQTYEQLKRERMNSGEMTGKRKDERGKT